MNERIARVIGLCVPVLAWAAPVLAQEGAQSNAPHGGEAGQPGLLDLNLGSILWVLILFIILAAILYKTAWKNVLAGLKAREDRIRKDIADAEAARARAEATLREYNQQLATAEQKVRDMMAKATSDAEQLAASIRTRALQDSEETMERAKRDIENAREQALSEIYAQTAELSTRIAEKILRRNLNADDQRELVNQSLQEIQTIK